MSPCVLWPGRLNEKGYGDTYRNGQTIGAHRLAYITAFGEVPSGHHVHHVCGNRACVNVEHLVLLTASEHVALHNSERFRKHNYCRRGHSLEDAYYFRNTGKRKCRVCERARARTYYSHGETTS